MERYRPFFRHAVAEYNLALLSARIYLALFTGPRMYYSILGFKGLVLGAEARVLRKRTEVRIEHPNFPHPLHLRLRSTDVALCREILVEGLYECDLARPPSVIVDAGANIGIASVFYAHRYPNAKIIAVEPEPSNYHMLLKNTACYPNVTPVRAALWNRDAEVDIIDNGSGHTTFQTQEPGTKGNGHVVSTVRAVTMDRLMTEFGINAIDLLKIDIEGAEGELFQTAEKWVTRVGLIAVEIHEQLRPGSTASIRAAAHDFNISWINGDVTYLARKGVASAKPGGRRLGSVLPLRILDSYRDPASALGK